MACVSPVNLYFLTLNPYDNVIYFYLLFTKVKFNKNSIKRIVKEDKKRMLRINRLQTERKCPESGFSGHLLADGNGAPASCRQKGSIRDAIALIL